jgi:AcrR family transcriptional regulator
MAVKRQSIPSAERKALIVQAVIALAAERNPEKITTAAVAEHMGLSQGALFKHFATKEEIRLEVMRWSAAQLLKTISDATERICDPIEALEAAFRAHLNFAFRLPGVPRIVFSELQREGDTPVKQAARDLMKNYSGQLCAWLKEAQKIGLARKDLNAQTSAMAMIGIIQGLIMQTLLGADTEVAMQQAEATFAIFRRGIATERGDPCAG